MDRDAAVRNRKNTMSGSLSQEMICLNCQAAFQCAPVLLGIKPSNLLIIDPCHLREACRLLRDTRVSIRTLYGSLRPQDKAGRGKVVLFVCRRELMDQVLQDEDRAEFLRRFGYEDLRLPGILCRLQKQYAAYMEKRLPFPHELGILLGYPLADVEGFIQNRGENFLYSGYWKVYANAEEAKRTFRLYEFVRRGLTELTGQGMEVSEAIRRWEGTGWEEAARAAG